MSRGPQSKKGRPGACRTDPYLTSAFEADLTFQAWLRELGRDAFDDLGQLVVRARVDLIELRDHTRDALVRSDYDDRPAVHHVVVAQPAPERGVGTALVVGVAGE